MRMFFKRWFWRLFLLLVGIVFAYQFWIFGHVVYWNSSNPSSSAFMEDRLALLRQGNRTAALRMQWVPYERISPQLKRAIIAAEDSKFLTHEGFDFDAIQNAYQKNVKKRKAPPSVSSWQKIYFFPVKKLRGARFRKPSSH